MARKKEISPTTPECSLCGHREEGIGSCADGFVCQPCLERWKAGRDRATRAARALKISRTDLATAKLERELGDNESAAGHEYSSAQYAKKAAALFRHESTEAPVLAHGEAVPRSSQLADTLKTPGVVALDASAHRLELLGRLGVECVAMGLDAADAIQAGNSLEKMLGHQLAVAHKVALEIIDKAQFQRDPTEHSRSMNLAVRFMEAYQNGLLTLQRIRSGGDQRILVQHVTVSDGGQAIVGSVRVGGRKKTGGRKG